MRRIKYMRWLGRNFGSRRRPPPLQARARRRGTKTMPKKAIAIFMALVIGTVGIASFHRFDRRILPLVLEAAELRLQAQINNVINQVVQEIIVTRNVTAQDFIIHTAYGQNPVLSVNTVLVNDISNAAAQQISQMLNNLEPETVHVPMGMALGLDTLAQTGPRFSFTLAPIGNALVFHESQFTAVGINQTHFSVWLTVESVVRIINPVHSSEVIVVRNVSLVDTVISGTVPDAYLSMDAQGVGIGARQ